MILVIGATGNIGSEVVRLLVADGKKVRALSRDAAKAKAALPAGVEVSQGDLHQPQTLAAALAGIEKLFFVSDAGPELAATGAAVFEAAQAAGVKHVVAVSSGTILMQPPTTIGRWHLELEEKLKATKLAWTMLRPGGFASNALRWAGQIKGTGSVFMPHTEGRMVPIDPRDIAAVAAKALANPGHEGKTYVITGSAAVSGREQVEAVAAALGKPIKVVEVPEEGAKAGMLKSGMSPIMVDAVMELIRAGASGHGGGANTTVRDITGKEPRTFAEWARDHVAAFR
jgi:uncharacterized protein YbjT (DUF2867 family)